MQMENEEGEVDVADIKARSDLTKAEKRELLAFDLDNDGKITKDEIELITSPLHEQPGRASASHSPSHEVMLVESGHNEHGYDNSMTLQVSDAPGFARGASGVDYDDATPSGQPGAMAYGEFNGCYQSSKKVNGVTTFVYVENGMCTFSGAGPGSAVAKEKWRITKNAKTGQWIMNDWALLRVDSRSEPDQIVWAHREEPGLRLTWTRIRSKDAVGTDQSKLFLDFCDRLGNVNFFTGYKQGSSEYNQRLRLAATEFEKVVSQLNSPRSPRRLDQVEGTNRIKVMDGESVSEASIKDLLQEMRLMRQEIKDLKDIVRGSKRKKTTTGV